MTPAENERLTQFLRDAANRAKREIGYPPNHFLSALNSKGGYATVLDLLAANRPPSDGFVKLWENKRLDLSVEALILESDWYRHFPEDVLRVAEKRLQDARYVPKLASQADTAPEPPPPSDAATIATAPRLVSKYRPVEQVWRITGPVENFITAVQRGHWALNDNNVGSWEAIKEGDIVVFHSVRSSLYFANPPSAILGFARVGARKFRKTEHWWVEEIQKGSNLWPNAFAIEDVCLAPVDLAKLDLRTPLETKTEERRRAEVRALVESAYPLSDIEKEAREIEPDVPSFPVNGSISRVREVYRRTIISDLTWVQVDAQQASAELEVELLTDGEREEIAAQDREELLAAAQKYQDPPGPSHKQRQARVRIENARQKYRVACLEGFTCQVCGYCQGYVGKSGVQRWIIQVDHIIQKADAGGEAIGNLWVLCPRCHAEKTCGVLTIDPKTYAVTRLGSPVSIQNSHLPID
ncbi:HNH endonuclease signature motif containing protein [Cognatilysobacter tabacisoli]|uniref:HNH endonuclease signature motif containing protein n=1 Tax=Cognatilysobacter tabacisoli TaxID=2315424 RepID=UPI000E6B4342|nr:HNH endonuclease signature motif containing protein [Lysobacter tabacisoli]